jgi:hypothetical protein
MVRRWTAHHPKWKKEVSSVAIDSRDGLLFFDPLDPGGTATEERQGAVSAPPGVSDLGGSDPGQADHTFITTFFHARDARGRVWAHQKLVRRLANRGVAVTDPFELGDELPGGVQALDTARDGEVLYWVPSEQALIVGDVLLGSPFRLCPKSWMGTATLDELKTALAPLLDLPIEQIHMGHGEPVLTDGRSALAALL